jgi:hypothetical protein
MMPGRKSTTLVDAPDLPLYLGMQSSLARGSDPLSSKEASLWFRRSGRLARQQRQVYRALCDHPGSTARELALLLGLADVNIPARRLPTLEDRGFVRRGPRRRCQVTGMEHVGTWYPVGHDRGTLSPKPANRSRSEQRDPLPIATREERARILEELARRGDAVALRLLQSRHADGGGGAK